MIRIFRKLVYITICLFSCALYLSAQGATANAPDFAPQATSASPHLFIAQVSDSVRRPATHISTPYQGVLTTLSVSNIQVRGEYKIFGNKNFTMSIVNQRAELWAKGGSEEGFTPPQTIILTIQAIDKFSDLHTNYSDLTLQATITVMIMPSDLSFSPPSVLTVFYGDIGAFLTVATYSGTGHKTYHLTVANGVDYFGIDTEYGILTVHGLPTVKIYTLAVDVVDETNAKATANVTVAVEYAPLQLDTPPELLAIVSMMASLHTFVARGGDLVYTYTILSGNDMGYFVLGNEGVLSLTATNAEARDRYTLSVKVADGIGGAVTAVASVNIVDTLIVNTVCSRTPQVRNEIENRVGKECEDITNEDLGTISILTLDSQNITSLKEGDFLGLSNLAALDLSDNGLTTLPVEIFNDLSSLEELDLSDNDLMTLPVEVFNGLSNLEELYLWDNNLITLPDFNGLGNLTILELQLNNLTTLPVDVFNGLNKLLTLYLWGNDLTTLSVGVFNGLDNLVEMDLVYNNLTTLPADVFNGLDNLVRLYMDYNNLTTLPAGVFNGLDNLGNLWLNHNDLTTLSAGVFNGLSNLRELDLDNNNLTNLPAGVFNGLSNLVTLDLENNPGANLCDSYSGSASCSD